MNHIIKFIILHATSSVKNSYVSKKSNVSYFVRFHKSSIGDYSYISNNCNVFFTSVGRFSSIGLGCNIGGGEHPTDWVSTSPAFHEHPTFDIRFSNHKFEPYKKTVIGNDVWIAANVIVKSGVTIGDGAIVGAGAVVTKDIPPYEIWAGNPARFIKKRFSDEIVEELRNISWWDWSDQKLLQYAEYFNNPQLFIEKYNDRENH